MKKLITVALSLLFAVCMSYTAIAGSLDSPGTPSAGSGMYTLQNLYDYMTSGTALTVQGSFQEPTSGPTAGTMKTTREIGDAIKALHDQCNATADKVASGTTFFCTQAGSWGVQTGTAQLVPTPTATPTPTPTWGSVQCVAKGGKWRATQLSVPDDFGCWIYGELSSGATCNEVCSTKGLACAAGDWNDTPTCDVCREYAGGGITCLPTNETTCGWAPAYYPTGPTCYKRQAGCEQWSCDSLRVLEYNKLCVCKPTE
ncbi:MAG: hypothetical protein NTZ78_13320 [Candidatus Aureabacteria bacterium]|nr:hypothetical protein [Candidatus Auribacterota bacterium]